MMPYLVVGLLLVVATSVVGRPQVFKKLLFDLTHRNEDDGIRKEMLFTTVDFIRKYGYPVETHTVTTEDGYLLTVHRIPGSPRAPSSGVKTPVLLQHGLGATSDCWVLSGPDRSLGFILADEGYDVWLGNARGNVYSNKHVSLSALDPRYTDYTFHEMGIYDLPVVIDHILKTTNHQQLFYVGHSMGCAMFFVLTSMRPEYNEKIRLAVVLAPAVYIWKPTSIMITGLHVMSPALYTTMGPMNAIMRSLGSKPGSSMTPMIYSMCADNQPAQRFCIDFYHSTFGRSEQELNTTLLPVIISHGMSGYTPKVLEHLQQLIRTERFQMYSDDRLTLSAQPEYDLSKVSAPISVHYSVNDILVPPEGVIHLSKRLPNLANLVRVPDDKINHIDFLSAIHVKKLVNDDVLDIIKKFEVSH